MKKIETILRNFMKMHINIYSEGNHVSLLAGSAQIYR